MTAKANHATSATSCPAPVVLFGIDSHGKPKGARFGKDQADLAIKAANQLQLRVLASDDPKVADLALSCRLAGFTRPAVLSCRSFDATFTTSWSPPPRTETPIQQARRKADPRALRGRNRLEARRPTCPRLGRRSASGIWSSLSKVPTTAGTRQ